MSRAQADGFELAPSRSEFLAASDVLSLHIRLNDQTRGLVTLDDLTSMKTSALWVNTSRAELVAPGALVEALQCGRPGFAAVDVYESEPVLSVDHPILNFPNALCTPHIGYVERDNYEHYFGMAFDNVNAFANGKPQNLANAEVVPKFS
jgi:D-3-phosphoglycerate dehydrogenase